MQRVIDAFREDLDEGVAEACQRVIDSGNSFYARFPREHLHVAVKRVFEAVLQDLESGIPQALPALLRGLGTQRSAEGAQIAEILTGMDHGYQTISDRMIRHFPEDMEARLFWEMARGKLSYAGAVACSSAFLAIREQRLTAQAAEILELSARVLPLARGVLLMPLVGRIDGARIERIMDVLLAAVGEHGATVVLLDVTGLPAVDAEVASHLLRAASAVRLLGATPALVGVRPALAQTIASAGVDLGGLVTLGRLEDGLRYARDLLGRR